jgi:hypothetical protein
MICDVPSTTEAFVCGAPAPIVFKSTEPTTTEKATLAILSLVDIAQTERRLTSPTIYIDEIGRTCEEGYMYSVCSECCMSGDTEQNEACANGHDHMKEATAYCATMRAISGEGTKI